MADMFDYLDWFGGFDFDRVPFNEVDNIILSQLSYLKIDGMLAPDEVVRATELRERFTASGKSPDNGPLISSRTNELLTYMVKSGRRFADAKLAFYETHYNEEEREQFAALTIQLSDGSNYVAFRGTDATLVAWIEDGDMSHRVVPAQRDALAYLRRVADAVEGTLRVGGHSKGGNLAAYAAAMAPELDGRIVELWCNDSPGFEDEVVPLSTFERLRDRAHLFTPEYSVVAGLMTHPIPPVLIISDGQGVMEHSATSWQVMRGQFVRGKAAHQGSVHVVQAFNSLLERLNLEERQSLMDELYQAFVSHDIHNLSDIMNQTTAGLRAITDSMKSLDEETKNVVVDFIADAMGGAVRGAAEKSAEQTAKALAPVAEAVNAALTEAGEQARDTLSALKEQAETRFEELTSGKEPERAPKLSEGKNKAQVPKLSEAKNAEQTLQPSEKGAAKQS